VRRCGRQTASAHVGYGLRPAQEEPRGSGSDQSTTPALKAWGLRGVYGEAPVVRDVVSSLRPLVRDVARVDRAKIAWVTPLRNAVGTVAPLAAGVATGHPLVGLALTLHMAQAVGFLVRRSLHRGPEALMSDTISPSVTFRVPRGRDAVRRPGGPRRSLRRGDPAYHYTTHGRPRAPALSADTSSIPRLKLRVLRRFL